MQLDFDNALRETFDTRDGKRGRTVARPELDGCVIRPVAKLGNQVADGHDPVRDHGSVSTHGSYSHPTITCNFGFCSGASGRISTLSGARRPKHMFTRATRD